MPFSDTVKTKRFYNSDIQILGSCEQGLSGGGREEKEFILNVSHYARSAGRA